MKKILIIGPFPDPISGVSLANQIVNQVLVTSSSFKTSKINTSYPYFEDSVGSFSLKKVVFFLKLNIQAFKILNNDIIYFTPGQTFFGILKYALFILLSSIFNKELVIHIHGNFLGTQYKLLKSIKKKICPTCKGKKGRTSKTCIKCYDNSGSNNPNFGKKHSIEARKKMSASMIKRRKSKKYIDPMKNPEHVKKIRVKSLWKCDSWFVFWCSFPTSDFPKEEAHTRGPHRNIRRTTEKWSQNR